MIVEFGGGLEVEIREGKFRGRGISRLNGQLKRVSRYFSRPIIITLRHLDSWST